MKCVCMCGMNRFNEHNRNNCRVRGIYIDAGCGSGRIESGPTWIFVAQILIEFSSYIYFGLIINKY